MEENVSLDTSKAKLLVKSAQGIRKLLIKKSGGKRKSDKLNTFKDGKIKKRRPKIRGLVYLSHIPHGFYEHQMTQYFKQFGAVTNCRVIRSKRTGNSKGCAFVEFKNTSVAEIVAETMNNYLMGKRLLKAVYIPPEEQRRKAMRKKWNTVNNPGNILRQKMKLAYNEKKDEAGELQRASKLINNFLKTKKKLKELGINYDFFTPVDVPAVLLKKLVKKESESNEEKNFIQSENKQNAKEKKIKPKKEDSSEVKHKSSATVQVGGEKQAANTEKIQTKSNKSNGCKQKLNKSTIPSIDKSNMDNKAHLKEQNNKLKKANVKPLEDFITVKQSDDDSESPLEFDSDEYEKIIESDSGAESDENDSDSSNCDNISDEENDLSDNFATEPAKGAKDEDSESDEITEMTPPKKRNLGKNVSQQNSKQQTQRRSKVTKHTGKRKNIKNPQATAKMGKFKETALKPKQFKKKKQ